MPLKKGHKKYGGRTEGTPNKTTQQMREAILAICENQTDRVNEELAKLEGKEFIDSIVKLAGLVMPKQAEIDVKEKWPFKVVFENGEDRRANIA